MLIKWGKEIKSSKSFQLEKMMFVLVMMVLISGKVLFLEGKNYIYILFLIFSLCWTRGASKIMEEF